MKNTFISSKYLKKIKPSGFALISSLMIMMLLMLVALAMLSLSSTTSRGQAAGSAQIEAQANARMALMIAIGELQSQMGPDQRISANGDILSLNESGKVVPFANPMWTGVWDSWIAGDPSSVSVGATYPSGTSHHQTIGEEPAESMHPAYQQKDKYFRSWLLSLDSSEVSDISAAERLALAGVTRPDASDSAIRLVGRAALGMPADAAESPSFVNARLLPIRNDTGSAISGRYGWWVGDESQKARIMDDSYEAQGSLTNAEKIFRGQAPGSTGTTTVEGLESVTGATPLDSSPLNGLPSHNTLNLLPEAVGLPAQKNFHSITTHSYGVLADVREGGLKRDLSFLLERNIDPLERGDEFMLYKFNKKDTWANDQTNPNLAEPLPDTPQEAVPIQDLAAFYQLYDQSRKGGIEYVSGSPQIKTPNYGNTGNFADKFNKEYTSLYRNPVPIKVQFLVSLGVDEITAADKTFESFGYLANSYIPTTDTHKLRIAVLPVVTLWNPFNVPIVMQSGSELAQQLQLKPPPVFLRITKNRSDGGEFKSAPLNFPYMIGGGSSGPGAEPRVLLAKMDFGAAAAITLEPGEVKVFSMPYTEAGEEYSTNEPGTVDAVVGWNPTGYLTLKQSTLAYKPDSEASPTSVMPNNSDRRVNVVLEDHPGYDDRGSISLNKEDTLSITIGAEFAGAHKGEQVSKSLSPRGTALCFYMTQRSFSGLNHRNLRQFGLVSRFGADIPYEFNNALLAKGMPGGLPLKPLEEITVSSIINTQNGGETLPLMQVAMMAGSETSEASNAGVASGRRLPGRPFLHSSPLQTSVIDQDNPASAYNHGWNWWFEEMNSVLEALVQESQAGNGYYGGGYSVTNGVTHLIQQEVPVTPPISIAALSHARLGGFTLASEAPVAEGLTGKQLEGYGPNAGKGGIGDPTKTLGFQRVTATGQAGLFPHVLQAIGNSYANPNLNSDLAYDSNWIRHIDTDDGEREVTFADHSYLANKALWDDYFFSSLTPKKATVEIFENAAQTSKQVAEDFFFGAIATPLPNHRISAYSANINSDDLDTLFTQADTYQDGLADKIASHLMVKGSFNVNSTSVEAWKILFSSMKGKAVAYFDGTETQQSTPSGTPVSFASLPNAGMYDDITTPNDPAEQWTGWRDLSNTAITELANAMVKQVKLRGPFLSQSEFINRRLGASDDPFSVKGALQAALDDEDVSINANFREAGRTLDDEVDGLGFNFQEAAKGPIAYGSSAYVDQADILRGLAEQLTPRGDTFIIRSYGDSIDDTGKVQARAWCEAVVQRVPDYLDSADESHLKTSALSSEANKKFGRKFQITSFRWLNANEI